MLIFFNRKNTLVSLYYKKNLPIILQLARPCQIMMYFICICNIYARRNRYRELSKYRSIRSIPLHTNYTT